MRLSRYSSYGFENREGRVTTVGGAFAADLRAQSAMLVVVLLALGSARLRDAGA